MGLLWVLACHAEESFEIQGNNPVALFSHGIADTYRQAFKYYNLGIIKKPFYTFNFPDATTSFTRVNREYTVFAQNDEITYLQDAYNQVRKLQPEQKLLLYGVSRGASTILNFLAQNDSCDGVCSVVLESPFAAIDDVVYFLADKKKISTSIAYSIFSLIFPRYQWSGVRPIDVVSQVPKNIPLLLICSTSDGLVPYTTTIKLYNALLDAECCVYLAVLNAGSHAKLFLSEDWHLYKKATHAFYKKCGLKHDPDLAQAGEHLLFNTPYIQ